MDRPGVGPAMAYWTITAVQRTMAAGESAVRGTVDQSLSLWLRAQALGIPRVAIPLIFVKAWARGIRGQAVVLSIPPTACTGEPFPKIPESIALRIVS